MRPFLQSLVILAVLLAFGAAKLSFEDKLHSDMVEERLLQPPLKGDTSLQLGQTSAAVALGGLRSLVAAVWNLRAYNDFENRDWIKLEQSYGIITTLQPGTTSYWKTGAWHLHTNAAIDYQEKESLSSFRRSALHKQYIDKGAALLEEGIRQNPDNWRLQQELAWLWSSEYKLPDYERALKHYHGALNCESLPDYKRPLFERLGFYTMTRIPDLYPEALKEGVRLFKTYPQSRTISLVNGIFILQNALDTPEEQRIPDSELYPNPATQLHWLKIHWRRTGQDLPMHGVAAKIDALQRELDTP
ncbi:hypothetical protein HW115_15275 [Verrucomicrobiaceae bacterium N1E253]|uniref:Tetratricopeptide repeat protein n=1 Tax=Oceaniferula marina TaxID=2748318 RepID=A0A851GHH8_9BACT|nr:hypothetical protein [Oceaniferula marina]NWK56983.1 hypothetical protein [Oceaniferula marina]